jgi:L-alanine-DL-glutamate epimerase-like enolase superfamily enzyme
MHERCNITASKVQVFTVPTDAPEADGTLSWDSTTMVLVSLEAGGKKGIGYTYSTAVTGKLAETLLKKVVDGQPVFDHGAILQAMYRQVRNMGETGIAAMAISAIDNALWDLRARLLDVALVDMLGAVRSGIPVYGSGGFTTYSDVQLEKQLGGWAADGFSMVKMKIGTHPSDDPRRVEVARKAIGEQTELFVDANGAYTVTQALELGHRFAHQYGVRWFEEPVSSDNLQGMSEVRARAPLGMDLPAHDRCACSHDSAGRLHPLRRNQRLSRCGVAMLGSEHAALIALRTEHASARLLCCTARHSHGVFPRSRSHRAHVF